MIVTFPSHIHLFIVEGKGVSVVIRWFFKPVNWYFGKQ